jgi:Fe-S cluster assembly iron-binding protein IscA
MRISKRIGLAAAAAALTVSMGGAHAQEMMKLKIGTEGAYPPFNNLTADGKLEGFDIDIARALCEEMKADCEFVTQDWDGIIPALQAGKFDAIIASMSITDERKQQVDFTNKYYSNTLNFVAPKDSDFMPDSANSAVIGVQEGTISAVFAEETYPDAEIKAYPTQLEPGPISRWSGSMPFSATSAYSTNGSTATKAPAASSRAKPSAATTRSGSPCERAKPNSRKSSTPLSTPSAPTESTRKSTPNTSRSTYTADNMGALRMGAG